MTVYNRQIQQAKKKIAQKGTLVNYTRITETKNDDKPWQNEIVKATSQKALVFLALNNEDKKTVQRIEGSEVGSFYHKAIMADEGFEPSKNDKIEFADRTWSILDMNILRPDGAIILTTFILKA